MSGHSKWAQIKHKKGNEDEKRGKLFSKLSIAISIAARENPDPAANPRLRTAIEKAKENQMPSDKIERAIIRSTEAKEGLETAVFEAYGPEGVALVIETLTDNKNRTLGEIKTLFTEYDAHLGTPGSAQWAFERGEEGMRPKFTQALSPAAQEKVSSLVEKLEDRDDVHRVWTNAADQ